MFLQAARLDGKYVRLYNGTSPWSGIFNVTSPCCCGAVKAPFWPPLQFIMALLQNGSSVTLAPAGRELRARHVASTQNRQARSIS